MYNRAHAADLQYKLWGSGGGGGGGLRSAPDLDSVLVAPSTDCEVSVMLFIGRQSKCGLQFTTTAWFC